MGIGEFVFDQVPVEVERVIACADDVDPRRIVRDTRQERLVEPRPDLLTLAFSERVFLVHQVVADDEVIVPRGHRATHTDTGDGAFL